MSWAGSKFVNVRELKHYLASGDRAISSRTLTFAAGMLRLQARHRQAPTENLHLLTIRKPARLPPPQSGRNAEPALSSRCARRAPHLAVSQETAPESISGLDW